MTDTKTAEQRARAVFGSEKYTVGLDNARGSDELFDCLRELLIQMEQKVVVELNAHAAEARREALRPIWEIYHDYDYALVAGNTAKESLPWKAVRDFTRDLAKALNEQIGDSEHE